MPAPTVPSTPRPAAIAATPPPAKETAQPSPAPSPPATQPSAAPVSAATSPKQQSGAPVKPAPATPTAIGIKPPPQPLGPAAALTEVANYTGKDIAELLLQLRNAGFPNIQPSSTVNVGYVLSLLKRPLPSQPAPAPSKAAPNQESYHPQPQIVPAAKPLPSPAPAPPQPKLAQAKGWHSILGKTARVSDIAAYTHRAAAELVLRLRDAGHAEADASSLVDVALLFQLMTKPLPRHSPLTSPKQHPTPQPAPSPDTSSAPKPVSEARTILDVPYRATLHQVAALLGVKPPELLDLKVVCGLHQPVPPEPLLRLCHKRGYIVRTTARSLSST